ncbi:hypothetical protein [Gelatiniphilus marinus]|uniref:Uncharacterized protein n=1 Tax=Gelatiniphilus marinus TaxID=1759464 RepID=A0ABW5JM05_9FLAO
MNSLNENEEVLLVENRLSFTSKQQLTELFNKNASASNEVLFKLLEPYYEKGFLSLRPPVTEENEEIIFNRI